MASTVKTPQGEVHAEKVVIVTGPSVGAALQFFVMGVAVGAAAALWWRGRQENAAEDEMESRARRLMARSKKMAARLRELVSRAADVAGPALQNALAEGRAAARAVESSLEQRLASDGDEDDDPEQV